MNGGTPDDLYRSAFLLGKPPGGISSGGSVGGPGAGTGGGSGDSNNSDLLHMHHPHYSHSRNPSTSSSHSSFSLATSLSSAHTTALSTPNDSPPLDFLSSPAFGGESTNKLMLNHHHRETGPIRRVRQDASASPSPYPSQPPLRSNSFSGSDGHRSSSSEAEDIGALFPSYHQQPQHNLYQQPQQHQSQDYTNAATAMYSQPNRSNPGLALNNPLDSNQSSFQRMTINSDQALEQLAANVRAATTTSASDRAKHIFVQAWYVFSLFS